MVAFPELADISAVLGEQLSLEGICVQASVLVLLGDQFSLRGIWVWRTVVQGQLWGAETRRILSPDDPWFLCPDSSVRVPLGPGI